MAIIARPPVLSTKRLPQWLGPNFWITFFLWQIPTGFDHNQKQMIHK
jgi:hypothetical protein